MDEMLAGMIAPVQSYQKQREGKRRAVSPRQMAKDKRKNQSDPQESVRSGVVVTLSHPDERRQGGDRRHP